MHILFVIPRYWPSVGGAQLHSREWVQRLARDHKVRVITHQAHGSFIDAMTLARPEQYTDGDVPVYRIGPGLGWCRLLRLLARLYPKTRLARPPTSWLLTRALVPQIEAIVQEFQPDVMHAIHIGLVYSSEIAQTAARRQRVPFVWTPLPHIAGDGWRGRRFRRLYRTADRLIAMTDTERRWLIAQGAREEAVAVVPVGPLIAGEQNPADFRSHYGLGNDPVVLFLGQKLLYKGYRQLVEAAPLVWQQHPNARFVFIGPRTTESTAFFAKMDDPRLLELPAVNEDEKSSALAACDIFCMPSTQESLGGVYLEAWSFGKPVIAANIPTSREIISHGTDGLLVGQKRTSIASAITKLLANSELAVLMGTTGRQKVTSFYNWDRLTKKLFDVYNSSVDEPQ